MRFRCRCAALCHGRCSVCAYTVAGVHVRTPECAGSFVVSPLHPSLVFPLHGQLHSVFYVHMSALPLLCRLPHHPWLVHMLGFMCRWWLCPFSWLKVLDYGLAVNVCLLKRVVCSHTKGGEAPLPSVAPMVEGIYTLCAATLPCYVHTMVNTPLPISTAKLKTIGLDQYWVEGSPGNPQ